MKALTQLEDLDRVARRLFWWKSPAVAMSDRQRFLAQVMIYGTVDDIAAVRRYFSRDEFQAVLDNPPAGVFDDRSWAYWNLVFDRYPRPQMPRRVFESKS
ncbi:MAG: hypothetical protein ACYC9L_02660 [Sulfuricaulis sp.]